MKRFEADLHIHSVLSPCASLEMSPLKIIEKAKEAGLDIIGITDHNSTRNAEVTQCLGMKNGVYVLMGAEINTREEVHCLAFFENLKNLNLFQEYLDNKLRVSKNDTKLFGYQLIVDEDENIIAEEDRLLVEVLNASIDEIFFQVKALDGIFIPAHILRRAGGILQQLFMIPENVKADGLEVNVETDIEDFLRNNKTYSHYSFIRSSDSHQLSSIGSARTYFTLQELSFKEIQLAFAKEGQRKIEVS